MLTTFTPKRVAVSTAAVVAALLGWQAAASAGLTGGALPPVSAVLADLGGLLVSPDFWAEFAATVGVALAGLGTAVVFGVVAGILIGSFEPLRYATRAVLEILKPIPAVVILPLVVLVLGPTAQMSWFLVFAGAVLPILMQTIDGVHSTDPVARDTARSFGMGRAEILARVVLPSALPYVGTAIRVMAPVTLVLTVVTGLLGGGPGLGRTLYLAQLSGSFATLYAIVIVLGILGLLFQAGARSIERRLLHWHESYRGAVDA